MQSIIDFLSGIGNWLVMIGGFIISLFRDLVFLIELTGKFLAAIPQYLSWLPGPIAASVMLFPVVGIVLLISGRK